MYFDFEDYRPDITPVGQAISWREGVLISIIVHLVGIIALLLVPQWLPDREVLTAEQLAAQEPRDNDPPRFVFVDPREDLRAPKPPPRPEASDQDRVARAPERAPDPSNLLPFSRGNTPERVEQMEQDARRGQGPDPSNGEQALAQPETAQDADNLRIPDSLLSKQSGPQPGTSARAPGGGSLGEALRDLSRYVQRDQFENQQGGGGAFGPAIQFDTKGVEFGPWIRRFVAQVKRNWEPLIPQAAMSLSGRVMITFNVHKNGTLTDLAVISASTVDGFNHAAYGALASSNPTQPLPPEYPADKAFFTVTFFYNEEPR